MMTRKTIKGLDVDLIGLKKEFQEITDKIQALELKYSNLEKNCEEMFARGKSHFNCDSCSDVFSNRYELKSHMKIHIPMGSFKCEQCEKQFDNDWKLKAHSEKCKYYPCDQCEKKFKYENTMLKHTKIAHSTETLIFCHFFNNKKTCPMPI